MNKKNTNQRLDEALALHQDQQLDAAATIYCNILQEEPNHLQALHLLSTVYLQQNQYTQAIPLLKRALDIQPEKALCRLALATAYAAVGQLYQAAIQYKYYLATDPDDARSINKNVTAIYYARLASKLTHYPKQAQRYLKKALRLDPELTYAHIKLAQLTPQARYRVAYKRLQAALAINPDNADALTLLSIIMFDPADQTPAIDCLQAALKAEPKHPPALTQLAFVHQYACDWEQLESLLIPVQEANRALIKRNKPATQTPFMAMALVPDSAYNYEIACAHSKTITAPRRYYSKNSKIKPRRDKLRIGYLSGGFGNFPNSFLAVNLFEYYDRASFEVSVFSTAKNDRSNYRKRIKQGCDYFFDLHRADNMKIAQAIHENSVDILVELDGHVHIHKLGACAAQPAPIQMHYLGFPGTLGADFIDYYIADPIVIPEQDQRYFQEKIIYLPHCYQINDTHPEIATKTLRRQDFNLPEDQIVFCCFNQSYKIDKASFQAWINILKATPNSVLWLWELSATARHNLQQAAIQHGIDPQRLIFSKYLPRPQHLVRLQLADLLLDTFICNAHTTAADALWAGVPVITLQGPHFASRVASSMLTAIELPELITHSVTEYTQLATDLANNPTQLANIKNKLRRQRDTTPLFNSKQLIRHLEQAYQLAWQNYQSGESPQPIYVSK